MKKMKFSEILALVRTVLPVVLDIIEAFDAAAKPDLDGKSRITGAELWDIHTTHGERLFVAIGEARGVEVD